VPDTAAEGSYRVCTVTAPDNDCTGIEIDGS
jgi:hypothetical protein